MLISEALAKLHSSHVDWAVEHFCTFDVKLSPYNMELQQALANLNVRFTYHEKFGYYHLDYANRHIYGVFPGSKPELWWFLLHLGCLCCTPCTVEFACEWIKHLGAEVGYATFTPEEWKEVCGVYEAELARLGVA